MNEEEAIKLAESGWWKSKTAHEIVSFQLYEDRLCMDFAAFHGAVEKALGRPVFSHEFARPQMLRDEFEGKCPKRTVIDSLQLLQELAKGKPIVVVTPL